MPDMTLTKQDLQQIREVVRDEVRTEIRTHVDPLFQAVQLDIQRLDGRMDRLDAEVRSIRRELVEMREELTEKIDSLSRLVDGYVKRTEDWRQEFTILKSRHDKLHRVLVEKGVVSDDDLNIQG